MTPKFGIVLWIYLTVYQVYGLADGANIVFFFGVSSYSHRIPAWPLAEALAEEGHNITFISPFPAKSPNPKIFDYVPKDLKEWVDGWGDLEDVFLERKNGNTKNVWVSLPMFGIMMCEVIYGDAEYLEWVRTTKVDLLVLDVLANDCAYGMAHYWNAKVILYDTTAPFAFFTESYGLPDESSSIPSMESAFPLEMTFTQRLINELVPIVEYYFRKWNYFPSLEELTRQKLGVSVSFEEVERNTSLVFTNTHFGEEYSRSLPPNVIPIGGIAFTKSRKTLPKEMESFLSKGDGFVYMSFGTYAEFHKFDVSIQRAFIGAMQKLSHIQFLWKVDDETLIHEFPNRNVFISKWMPQQDILAHPKIRAFITHAGLIGIQEAIYNSVPLISFPIFADQDYNAERIHRKEYGIRLELITVTQPEIEEAITTILSDGKYRSNMKRISAMFTDRPQKPLETALWWTNFVLRHSKEDLAALRPLNVRQPWWMKRQLDVWITLFVCAVAVCFLIVYVIYILIKCVRRVTSTPSTQSNQRKKIQ